MLAMDYYHESSTYSNNLDMLNLAFFSFFVFELVVKLSGFGFKYYFHDKFNWFDSAVVFVGILDIILQYTNLSKITDYFIS